MYREQKIYKIANRGCARRRERNSTRRGHEMMILRERFLYCCVSFISYFVSLSHKTLIHAHTRAFVLFVHHFTWTVGLPLQDLYILWFTHFELPTNNGAGWLHTRAYHVPIAAWNAYLHTDSWVTTLRQCADNRARKNEKRAWNRTPPPPP